MDRRVRSSRRWQVLIGFGSISRGRSPTAKTRKAGRLGDPLAKLPANKPPKGKLPPRKGRRLRKRTPLLRTQKPPKLIRPFLPRFADHRRTVQRQSFSGENLTGHRSTTGRHGDLRRSIHFVRVFSISFRNSPPPGRTSSDFPAEPSRPKRPKKLVRRGSCTALVWRKNWGLLLARRDQLPQHRRQETRSGPVRLQGLG